ncbi:MAG: cob(I)yrinic acid a,c-diamide adenosyltransferase [Candidatus Omnitrophica bacterium]|nr:cob(I)yrinic acid a,c-diamide adenosyltransferase [Candidatus Omnitrophota bacterium]
MARKKFKTGLIHVYTGSGKGKTTAALGLAVRAAGAGLKVSIHQFMKNGQYSELKALKKINNIIVRQCGQRPFIKGKPEYGDIKCAEDGFRAAERDINSLKYDLVILDEINIALKLGLIKTKDVISLINRKPKGVELVLTGRGSPAAILKKADLITEMKEIRHPFKLGMTARMGIEY